MARKPVPQTTRRLLESALGSLNARLPPGWTADIAHRSTTGGELSVTAPNGDTGQIAVSARDRFTPRDATAIEPPEGVVLVTSSWLSPRTRELLEGAGVGYLDETGNAFVVLDRPGLFIRTEGARRDPSPTPTKGPNLRGGRAWAAMRTLVEVQPPYGVSDLAAALGADAGYVSRILAALAEELLITREPRGPVQQVEWEPLLRQITVGYSLLGANETTSWVAPGGAEQFLRDLEATKTKGWAITGSFAASQLVSVAAPEIAVVFAEDPERIASVTRLRPVRNGGNVVTALPYDPIVFERTWRKGNAVYASLAQIAMDCLTGPGRMPAEGEALLDWLGRKAPRWQAPALGEPADLP